MEKRLYRTVLYIWLNIQELIDDVLGTILMASRNQDWKCPVDTLAVGSCPMTYEVVGRDVVLTHQR
jgi:hypothetical protein